MKVRARLAIAASGVALAVAPVAVLASGTAAAATEVQFDTPGAYEWTVPAGVSCVDVDVYGANGGDSVPDEGDPVSGGVGGLTQSTLRVLAGQSLQVNVGGRGGDAPIHDNTVSAGGAAGYNGGGAGGDANDLNEAPGGGGGGASDIRMHGTTLDDRVVVAGGGGGAGGFTGGGNGGDGGGESGDPGFDAGDLGVTGGGGGTSIAGGTGGTSAAASDGVAGGFGTGGLGGQGATLAGGGGGGGGGWYGGGGGGGMLEGEGNAAGGGGGSATSVFGGVSSTGVDAGNGGDGLVLLSYTPGDTSCLAAPLTVKKTTAGAAPTPGQTFMIRVACTGNLDNEQVGSFDSVDLTFTADAAGVVQPASGYVVGFDFPGECSVAEIDTGGAIATTYACEGSGADVGEQSSAWLGDSAVLPGDPCVASGPQSEPIAVEIFAENQVATVTVTNELVAPAAAQVVQPRFTG